MAQTIQDFFRVSQARDFARDYMLRVVSIGEDTFNEDDFVYITTANLPDRTISNQTATYMGLDFNVPGTVKYPGSNAWAVTFRNDKNGVIRKKFEDWQIGKVFDDATSTGDLSPRGVDKVIQLNLVDDKLQIVNTYKLYGVYVVSLGNVAYNVAGTGTSLTFNATLAYHYWRHE